MKKAICLLLIMVMLLSALSGCGSKQDAVVQAAPETEGIADASAVDSVETVTEVAAEPTLSSEEVLYNSLPDRMKQAVDVGLAELSQLEDLSRVVTVGEASAMLQKAYVHRTGMESKSLNDLMNNPEYADLTADRGWVLTVPGMTDMELTKGENFENYKQWQNYLNYDNGANWDWGTEDLWYGFDDRLGIANFHLEDDNVIGRGYLDGTGRVLDEAEYFAMMGEDSLYGPDQVKIGPYVDIFPYALKAYDSTTGKKFFTLEEGYINPTKALTVEDAVEYALKFYHFPNPMAVPQFVAPENVSQYNTDIITPDLLSKETDLPAASCQQLPAWHGAVMKDMGYRESGMHPDDQIYEYEIRAIKEAGFNMIGLELDFAWLQDYALQDPDFAPFEGLVAEEDVGSFSVERLEQLDQVLAWCMAYDIHLNLRVVGLPDCGRTDQQETLLSRTETGVGLAACWQAIARRYADIPNEYLSFTLFTSSGVNPKFQVLLPSVDAIRQESPERCIIADICGWWLKKADAEAFAQAGVALSSRVGTEEKLKVFYHRGLYSHKLGLQILGNSGSYLIQNFQWPYNGMDARTLLASTGKDRVNETLAVAQENGVGFMVSDFGVVLDPFEYYGSNYFYPTYHYPEDAYKTMILDITSGLEELNCGWSFSNWYGYFGITGCVPLVDAAVYQQVEDYPFYINTAMYSWFKEINGVS